MNHDNKGIDGRSMARVAHSGQPPENQFVAGSDGRGKIHSRAIVHRREGVVAFLVVRRHRRSVFHAHADHD
jgi:hypothetical protein